jgi:hypothetical protein
MASVVALAEGSPSCRAAAATTAEESSMAAARASHFVVLAIIGQLQLHNVTPAPASSEQQQF